MQVVSPLETRWNTDEGREKLRLALEAIRDKQANWSTVLRELPDANQIGDHRDLRYAPLSGVNLDGALLDGTDLSGANLTNATAKSAQLRHAQLKNAILDGMRFDSAILPDANLAGAEARGAYFTDAMLQNASMQGMTLQGAHFQRANLTDGHLDGATLQATEFDGARIERASFQNAVFEQGARPSALFVDAKAEGADFRGANLTGVRFLSCDLREANFFCAHLRDASFEAVDLTRANFHSAALHGLKLHNIRFDERHLSLHDGTEGQLISRRQKYLSWSTVRNLGAFPFFGVSWTAFFLALGAVEGLEKLNSWLTRYQTSAGLQGDLTIGVPSRIMWILFDALLLVVGSTLYRACCPKRVQEFTEVAWVEKSGRPRLQYWEEAWRRSRLAILTLLLLSLGALIAFLLVAERFVRAVWYVGGQYGWWRSASEVFGQLFSR